MFGFLRNKWPDDAGTFNVLCCALAGACITTSKCFRASFHTQALEHDLSGADLVFPSIIREFIAFSPILLWTVGTEYFKPDDEAQMNIVLRSITDGYIRILNDKEFKNAVMATSGLHEQLINDFTAEAAYPIFFIQSISRYVACDISVYKVTPKDSSDFVISLQDLEERTLSDSFRICQYAIKHCLEGCGVKQGKEFGASDITPFTLESFHLLHSATKAILDGTMGHLLQSPLQQCNTHAERLTVVLSTIKTIVEYQHSRHC